MVRSQWVKTLGALLVSTGLVWGQQPTSGPGTPPGPAGEIITIQEAGKPAQKCKVLRTWRTTEGALAHEVKTLDGGEVMTIVEGAPLPGPAGDHAEARSTRIFHWGSDGKPPAGTPAPTVQQAQYTAPAPQPGAVRYVPVPVSPPAGASVKTLSPGSPVVVTEVPEERPGFGTRVRGMASHLLHHDQADEMPTVVEMGPAGGAPVTTTGPMPQVMTGSMPTAAPGGVRQVSATAPASGAWPSAYAQGPTPAGGTGGTSYSDNPIMGMSPPTAGAPPAKTRLVPTTSPAACAQCQAAPAPTPAPCAQCQSAPVAPSAPAPIRTVSAQAPCTYCEVHPATPAAHQAAAAPAPTSPCTECQSCGTPVVVDGTLPSELQPRHGLRSRLAGLFSKDPAPGDLPPGAVVISETPVGATAPVASAAPCPCATSPTEPAKPGDWRQSWGKLDTSKTDATMAAKSKTPEGPKTDLATSSKPGTSDAPKTDTTASSLPKMPFPSVASAPPPLPTADSKGSDPLKDPAPYTRHGTDDKTAPASPSKPWYQGVADAGPPVPAAPKDQSASALPSFAPTDAGKMPLGAKSVLDSGSSQYVPVPIVTVPDYRRPPQPPAPHVPQPPEPNYVDMSNAFTNPSATPPPPTSPQAANAFSPTPAPVETSPAVAGAFGVPGGGYPAAGMYPPPGYGGPRAPGMMPPGMMPAGYTGMMPRGMYPQMPSGPAMPALYQPNPAMAGQPVQQMSYTPPAAGMGAGPQVAMANPPVNLLPAAGSTVPPAEAITTLRDSIYPSQREWSAGQLASVDWRAHGDVVQALVTAAREDPAPLVRAACVRALARMGCNSAPVLNTLQALKTDGDPRVLHEVEQALGSLAPGAGAGFHSGVVPAGARMPH